MMKKQYLALIVLFVITLLFSVSTYSILPNVVPSHWGINGEVDGYTGKTAHVVFFTLLSIGMPLLLLYLPKLDPKYTAIKKFEDAYLRFIVTFGIFFTGLYVYTTAISLGAPLPIDWFIIPGISLLFINIGSLLRNSEQNYTIGIRTAWTLSSESNWKKTHQLGAKLFTWGGLISILSVFFGKFAFIVFFTTIIGSALIPVVYSYLLYLKEAHTKKPNT